MPLLGGKVTVQPTRKKVRDRESPRRAASASRLWGVKDILRLLEPLYAQARSPRAYDAVSELIYTILSQNTADYNSTCAYARLRETFPTWEDIISSDPQRVAEAIQVGGLAQVKAPRLQAVLKEIKSRQGDFDLSFLRDIPLADAKAWLMGLPGVGPKTAACVLLFALSMPALPVDTHIHRVARRLGLIEAKVTPNQSHAILESMLKPEEVLPFHIYLITHGRRVCKAQRPLCSQCVLEPKCPSSLLRE